VFYNKETREPLMTQDTLKHIEVREPQRFLFTETRKTIRVYSASVGRTLGGNSRSKSCFHKSAYVLLVIANGCKRRKFSDTNKPQTCTSAEMTLWMCGSTVEAAGLGYALTVTCACVRFGTHNSSLSRFAWAI
jgi:hypothetical protein